MALKAQVVLLIQRFDHSLLCHLPGQFFPFLLFYQYGAKMFCKIFIPALNFQSNAFRFCSRQILVGILFKIHHDKAVEQSIDAADNITHFPVFLFQQFPFPSRADQKDNNINDKHPDQHGFQLHSYPVPCVYHALRHIFREDLYKDILAFGKIHHADIVRFAVRTAYKGTFPSILEDSPRAGRRIRIDHAG